MSAAEARTAITLVERRAAPAPVGAPTMQEFERLYRECAPIVYRTARGVLGSREDAEDVVQSVFMTLVRREAPPTLENPKAYFYKAAVMASLNVLRARRRRPALGTTPCTSRYSPLFHFPASMNVVWRRMQPDLLRASAPSFVPPGRQRAWTFLSRAVAAMLVLGMAIGTAMVWPRGARVYAAGADGLQVTLADDSRVEMRAYSEMIVGRASDGIQIDLKTGDIIITAAARGGQLYVRTNDMTVAVDGTAFLAHAGQQGSRVGVIEGEVRVREGDTERRLRPGEQVGTSPTIARRLVGPGGLKTRPAAPDSCTPVKQLGGRAAQYTVVEGQALLPNFPERPTLSDVRRGQKPVCGQILERNGPNRVLVAGGSTFGALAQVLGRRGLVGPVRVYDKTGITDTFDWILEFLPEEDRGSSSPAEPSDVPPGPTIFVALQELGLRLEPAQAPRDVIVIDAIERPGPN